MPSVRFLGAQSAETLRALYRDAIALIMPSICDEVFGLVLIEAMACGVCIVSTKVGGIPYLIEDGCDGLLVPDSDEVAMAMAVRRLMVEEGVAGRLSRNGRIKVEQFDWSAILPQWERLLSDVAEKHSV